MRILFLTHYFPPEVNAPAVRTWEHCRRWAAQGHEVHIVTCVPSHPLGAPFPGYRPGWYLRETIDGLVVHRIWTFLARNRGTVRRTLSYLSFVPTALYRSLRLGPFDVIVATSPQFFCAVAGSLAGWLTRTPWIFELRDLWPDSIRAVGAMQADSAMSLLEGLELQMYRRASAVVCVTRSFMDDLERRGIPRSKLYFVPNGIQIEEWDALDRGTARLELGLAEDELAVSYVGTLGMAHGLATLLGAAELVRESYPSIKFLVAGEGADGEALRRRAEELGLENVRFLGLLPRERAQRVLAASDVALVLLKRSPLFETVLPSKMFEAMAAGVPIVLGVGGEARRVLEAAGAGVAIPPEDATALAAALGGLLGDTPARRRMGAVGREFVKSEFDRSRWADRYVEILETHARTRAAGSSGVSNAS